MRASSPSVVTAWSGQTEETIVTEEARVNVRLHQDVDRVLGLVEYRHRGCQDVPLDVFPDNIVYVDLKRFMR